MSAKGTSTHIQPYHPDNQAEGAFQTLFLHFWQTFLRNRFIVQNYITSSLYLAVALNGED